MTCQQIQTQLSLYLYGELDFAQEEETEQHLAECAFCQTALAREKQWHSAANGEQADVSLELLAKCRADLRSAVANGSTQKKKPAFRWLEWADAFGFAPSRWSARIAFASFLMIIGFGVGRFVNVSNLRLDGAGQMSLIDPATAHIRDVQPGVGDKVRILVDQVQEREISGRVDDAVVRQLLLAGVRDPGDPGVRVDSVEILTSQGGIDVRDALLYAVRHDTNAGVRLKALEGLRRFVDDPETREGLTYVLEHDVDPSVRSQAIDLLTPANQKLGLSPELAGALEDLMQSDRSDEYLKLRCFQLLNSMKTPGQVY